MQVQEKNKPPSSPSKNNDRFNTHLCLTKSVAMSQL